nr:hypothetical protein RVX_0127 [Nitratidesulfovibrio sp. HK-II]
MCHGERTCIRGGAAPGIRACGRGASLWVGRTAGRVKRGRGLHAQDTGRRSGLPPPRREVRIRKPVACMAGLPRRLARGTSGRQWVFRCADDAPDRRHAPAVAALRSVPWPLPPLPLRYP